MAVRKSASGYETDSGARTSPDEFAQAVGRVADVGRVRRTGHVVEHQRDGRGGLEHGVDELGEGGGFAHASL